MTTSSPTSHHNIPEIDGLRAVAVGSVIAFHFGFGAFAGGYLGVDVFFVISGYLLTGLISKEMSRGEFSIVNFYVRRIRRIVPALVAMICLCVLVAVFVLTPGDYKKMAQSATAALSAWSNVFFFLNTGYFDPSATTMPLLHTWSLGVEEQFYVVWPLAIAGAFALSRKRPVSLSLMAIGLFCASLCSYIIVSRSSPDAAFYLPQNRAWELISGGIVSFARGSISQRLPRWGIEAISSAGLALIVTAVLMPAGIGIFVAVAGAALFLLTSGQDSISNRVLSKSVATYIGKISYSLYLYHWPVIVFWGHVSSFEPVSTKVAIFLFLITLIISSLSWRFVEQPFRRSESSRAFVILGATVSASLLGIVCAAVAWSGGLPSRLSPDVRSLSSLDEMWSWSCPRPNAMVDGPQNCIVGAPWSEAANRVVLWGDSNAAQAIPLLQMAIGRSDISAALFMDCSPVVSASGSVLSGNLSSDYAAKCDRRRHEIITAIKHSLASEVLLASAWGAVSAGLVRSAGDLPDAKNGLRIFEDSLRRLLSELDSTRRHIVLVGEIPKWGFQPVPCLLSQKSPLWRLKKCSEDVSVLRLGDYYDKYQRPAFDVLKRVCAEGLCSILDPVQRLCREGECLTFIDGEFLYWDAGHYRRNISDVVKADLAQRFGFTNEMRRIAGSATVAR